MLHSFLRRLSRVLVILSMAIPHTPSVQAAPTAAADLFFSEYVEGSSNNKALEIFNGTGADVDLSPYKIEIYFDGGTTRTLTLAGTIPANGTLVVAHSSAVTAVLNVANQTFSGTFYNGDDAIVLKKEDTIIDVIGQVGVDPGAEWGSGLQSTADDTLQRKSSICQGDPNPGDSFDPALEWDGFAVDTFDGLGSHSIDEDVDCTAPTAALLSDVTASALEDHVLIEWETLSEMNHLGFNLYRATAGPILAWSRLNETLISGSEPGSLDGQNYEWEDYDVAFGQRYLYRLEAMDMNGRREIFPEKDVIFGANRQIWLPILQVQ
jgi:hypothetical protein